MGELEHGDVVITKGYPVFANCKYPSCHFSASCIYGVNSIHVAQPFSSRTDVYFFLLFFYGWR